MMQELLLEVIAKHNIIQIALSLIGWLTLLLSSLFAFNKLIDYVALHKRIFADKKFVISLRTPILMMVGSTICYLTPHFFPIKIDLGPIFNKTIPLIFKFAIGWCLVNYVDYLERRWRNHIKIGASQLDLTTCSAVIKILKIAAILITLLLALEGLGVSISAIIAFGSASGFGISFAAKDIISNYFGAFMIYLDKPFLVGDLIKLPCQNITGHVDQIGLRCTVIVTAEKRPLYVPNALFANIVIENLSRMSHRLIQEHIQIRHVDFLVVESITKDIRNYLQDHLYIDKNETLIVETEEFSEHGIKILIYCCTTKTSLADYHSVISEILLKSAKIIEQHDAKIALVNFKYS